MKMPSSELIVMLTHNDQTVENAPDIFEQCQDAKANYWGFKGSGLPLADMKRLFSLMKSKGKQTFLEIVEYNEAACLEGAKMAVACQCDILMGTVFFDSVNNYCLEHNMKYMPFVGDVSEHPSILEGEIDKMVEDANTYIKKGAFGIDLLAYRYTGDQELLIKQIVKHVPAPVCVAGSINDYQRLAFIKEIKPWAFTIGGAFFENKFPGSFSSQIDTVCDYMASNVK